MRKRYQLPGIMLALAGVALGVFGIAVSPIAFASSVSGGSDGGLIFIVAGVILVVGSIITLIVLVSG